MRLLLDTHLLPWAAAKSRRLPKAVRPLLEDPANEVFFSAASLWEIAHAERLAGLPPLHKDPFDRTLVAQSVTESLLLFTNDDVLGDYGESVKVV